MMGDTMTGTIAVFAIGIMLGIFIHAFGGKGGGSDDQ